MNRYILRKSKNVISSDNQKHPKAARELVEVSSSTKNTAQLVKENENLRLALTVEQRKNQLLNTLLKISELTYDFSLDIDSLYNQIHVLLEKIINSSNFYIARYNDEKQTITFEYYKDTFGSSYEYPEDFPVRPVGNGVTEMVITSRKTVLLTQEELKTLFNQGEIARRKLFPVSWLGAPLLYDDEIMGAIVVQSYNDDFYYDGTDAEHLNFIAQHISSAIKRHEKKAIETINKKKLEYVATHDNLTGLLNRSSLNENLEILINKELATKKQGYAVLFIDLDGFKEVNDNFGHAVGDRLLIEVARTLQSVVRVGDLTFRLGGDEFVVLLTKLPRQADCIEITERLISELAVPISIDNKTCSIGASVGVVFNNKDQNNPEDILSQADKAMYAAKLNGKNCYEIFAMS